MHFLFFLYKNFFVVVILILKDKGGEVREGVGVKYHF